MATITIGRDLTVRQNGEISSLIPVFVRNSIYFYTEGADISGTYATVLIGSYEFRAVKTYESVPQHNYVIDLTTILINNTSIPYEIADTSNLTFSVSITIKLYSSLGVLLTSVNHPSVILSLGYSDIYKYTEVDVFKKGSSKAIYHNGKNICFFWSGATGNKSFNIASIDELIEVAANTYVIMNMAAMSFGIDTGTLTSADLATFSIPIYYKPPYGDQEIAWLNRDGGWSFWNFRKVSEEIAVKKSNEVATYYPTNAATISKSRMISAEKTVRHAFDTLAYDPTHFAQLCEIQESLAVIWNNKLVKVAKSNTLTAVCKQNLRFNLILEVDENIAGY